MKKPESKLLELVNRLQEACGENLVTVVLYGSAAREDFHEQYSDVNLLAAFKDLGPGSLTAIVPVIRWWTQEERISPPLIMTADELRESADVFAIELLDIQHSHRTLFGEDIVSSTRSPHEPASAWKLSMSCEPLCCGCDSICCCSPDDSKASCRQCWPSRCSSVLTFFATRSSHWARTPPHQQGGIA